MNRTMKRTTPANQAREVALRDACRDVCMYCGFRCPQWDSSVDGPNAASNYTHQSLSSLQTVLCEASSVWSRIAYEKKYGPIYSE